MTKVVSGIREAIELAGLKDGMSISFHHHLRNGDYVLNMVLDEIASMGIKDLTVNASAVFDVHAPLIGHIKNGVVTKLCCNYMSKGIGSEISKGIMEKPVEFRTHGSRPGDIINSRTPIDVAFIAAPTSDTMGNCTGKTGKSRFGSIGYAMADAENAKKVIVITDNPVDYPLSCASITEDYVDHVVVVEAIGDPNGIMSGTTAQTRDPVRLRMAQTAVRCIEASGLLKDGMSFQTGAGGATMAAAMYLKDLMLKKGIVGSYVVGGISSASVDLQRSGCFKALQDVQSFDLGAAADLAENPDHIEVSARRYASAAGKSSCMNNLDVALLGATEIDVDFNVNVHTDSNGVIMGGSGGHTDVAEVCDMAVVIAPLFRNRLPIVLDRVTTVSTPGRAIDVLITEKGIAVNPARPDLKERFLAAGLNVKDIRELKAMAEETCGVPARAPAGDKIVGEVFGHWGEHLDYIYSVPERENVRLA
ncbi:MAG: citrate lyase subunit alpha [Firmicutes bacterium]|nr:citrate lyase subunit alpha [Bacillota bacterium]